MGKSRVDLTNCLLLLAAGLLAASAPFGLFVLAYIILGPLHYLTEMVWLDKHDYFLPNRRDSRWLWAMAITGAVVGGVTMLLATWGFDDTTLGWIRFHGQQIAITAALLALAAPLVFWQFTTSRSRAGAIVLIAALGGIYYYVGDAYCYWLLFAVLTPTVVHVYFFTGAFMLSGALRSRSLTGIFAFGLLITGGASLLLLEFPNEFSLDPWFEPAYRQTIGFVNQSLLGLFDARDSASTDAVASATGMRISRFLAFAYTYHYLNWFSKTSIIGWHRLALRPALLIACSWMLCVLLYLVDYGLGLTVVGFLSILHVFFEFPLNWLSLRGIGREFRAICSRGWATA